MSTEGAALILLPMNIAHSFPGNRFSNPADIKRRELSASTRRLITRKQTYLDKTCRKVWAATNRLGETFIFGRFARRTDSTIVTLAAYVPNVGFVSSH